MHETLKEKSVLLVDDQLSTLEAMIRVLERKFKAVYTAHDGVEGLELCRKENPDFIITDVEMPHKNGIAFAREAKEANPEQTIIAITAFDDEAHDVPDADICFSKPIDIQAMLSWLAERH